MIDKVLTVLKDQLNATDGLWDPNVPNEIDIAVVGDIAKHEDETSGLDNKVVITLLSVEEESTLKNRSRYEKVIVDNNPTRYDRESPPAYLNLYVMVAANRSMYARALLNISKVIEIFQKKNVLEYVDTDPNKNFRFRIELHSVPFEQLSYIWGLLGGKVMPSVLYKISVIKIVAKDVVPVELINEVNIQSIKVD
ncbi:MULTISPECIES: DUF4255 domain-containing protein [unclassified Chryseobacterium]|uniref:DUF4255 domain-containing protein n=1 Tax=unclassified Chryseobacterium TaxID=2593645 RepID=UPI001157A272|nr:MULTISPECIES: DUF4255 domain-containing protein [unclassified Chryseobacterium]MBO9690443.1 DUF4255 domain-containing protein [Chryseobacterium sp.]GEJ45774.1 hypothetical protein CRS_23820 [Chryseobacterium sp. ON_d1]